MHKACEKRPLPTGTIEKLTDDIEAELYELGRTEIPSALLGDLVMDRLKRLDHVAYIRFASVYRDFADITALKREVDTLVDVQITTPPPISQLPLLPDDELATSSLVKSQKRRSRVSNDSG
jgi:transcriptional repressor NrdR